MSDANKIYVEAVKDAWEAYRGAMFNHIYHEDMAAHYERVAFWLKIATPTLIVLGVVAAMWQAPGAETAPEKRKRVTKLNILAFALALASIVTWAMTPEGQVAEHQVLSKQWLAIVGQIDKVRTALREMGPKEQVSPEMLAKIELFKDQSSALLQGEIDPKNDYYFELAKVESRKRIYGEHVLTVEDAKREYEKRKAEHRVPERAADPDRPPIDPADQSASPAARPSSSVARAQ
jgi:hypothetical protein